MEIKEIIMNNVKDSKVNKTVYRDIYSGNTIRLLKVLKVK